MKRGGYGSDSRIYNHSYYRSDSRLNNSHQTATTVRTLDNTRYNM